MGSVKPPVLILGYIPRIVTPIARSLQRHGVPVDVAEFLQWPRPRSRAVREFVRLPYPYKDPDEFVTELRSFISRQGHDLLLPTDDYALAAMVKHYDDLKDLLQIACPPPAVLRQVLDKAATLKIARKYGLDVPRTVVVSDSTQLHECLRSFQLPAILKPAEKHQRYDEFKSCLITSAADGAAQFPRPCQFSPPMLLQEYCHGRGVGVEVLIHKGECLAVFQHRRLKELPYGGGVAVTAIAEPPDPALVRSSLDLLRALDWEGIAMVEFKINPADGRAVFMEVNGRYWGTISLPILTGIDFPAHHWNLLHGQLPEVPSAYAAGTKWRWTVGYFARLHGLLAASGQSPVARRAFWQTIREAPGDFGPSFLDSIATPTDPMPSISEFFRAIRHYFGHDVEVVFKRLIGSRQNA